MDITLFITHFFYRIRYWLLWGSLLATSLVIYFTQFLPYSYTVESSLYAGVTNEVSIDGSALNSIVVNSTFDNLINIAKSQGTLSNVSVRLLANALTYGEEWKDNHYIQAKHYRQLLQEVPKEVLALIDRNNIAKTTENLLKYRKENSNNFIYAKFNRSGQFYSANALDQIQVDRAGSSDIINLKYTSADPGITQQTLLILIDEISKTYEVLRFKATNDVIKYFQEQVRLARVQLNLEEDNLMKYCVEKQVINYSEETKALANTRYGADDRLEKAMRDYESAVALREMLEGKMDIRAQMIRSNTNLLQELNKISELNQSIMEQEIFVSDKAKDVSSQLQKEKKALKRAEENVSHISDNLNEFNFTKEGVGIEEMIHQWLTALVNEAKAGAELKVLKDRQFEIFNQYSEMSPIGTQVTRKQRAIGIAEDNYRTQLNGLSSANLRLKNIEMNSSNIQSIAPPEYPLNDNGRKRIVFIALALMGSLVFIATYFLIVEMIDRTLRDPIRSKRLMGLSTIAAFNGTSNLKFRGFLKACNRIAAGYSCRQLDRFMQQGSPTVFSLFSMEPGEGKSYLSKYFSEYWETQDLKVRIVKAGVDFETNTQNYIQAQDLSDFWTLNDAENTPDIILVEYPAVSTASIPLPVLQKSDANLLIANACRLWKSSDNATIAPIKEAIKDTPLFLYLNNADREVVESFTGDLPPHTPIHSFISRLVQLGLTAKSAAVKN